MKETDSHNRSSLQLETLEPRMMLSTVEVFAAGSTGEENLDIFINGQYATTFHDVGGDVDSRSFQRLVFETDQPLTPGNVGVAFGNDLYNPGDGIDRNLLVDKIVVDGVVAETEDASTHSTGIWQNGLTGPGFYETELFNINAIFTYADPVQTGGDLIEFDAVGSTGQEVVELVVDDQVVQSFALSTNRETFAFSTGGELAIEDIQIRFVNDLYDAAIGVDRNAQIFEYRLTDGDSGEVEVARTTDADVLSSGIFVPGEGITAGFATGGFLASNGSVKIVAGDSSGLDASVDPSFASNDFRADWSAVGSNDQVVSLDFFGEMLLLDASGTPISSFGNNGLINLADLLSPRLDVSNPRYLFSDVEFFADGSILVTGSVQQLGSADRVSFPIIAKINPDGTLDESFVQQGNFQGTFLQLRDFETEVMAAIDSEGRVIVFGSNKSQGAFLTPINYIVARLNPDGTLDSSFANNGNLFISEAEFGGGSFSKPVDVKVNQNDDILFSVYYRSGSPDSVSVGRVGESGQRDYGFGDNGYYTVDLGNISSNLPIVELDSQDRIVVGADPGFPTVWRATADGLPDFTFGNGGGVLLQPDDSIASQGVELSPFGGEASLFIDGLAIDQDDNIVVVSSGNNIDGGFSLVLQHALSDGTVDTSFGLAGTSVIAGTVAGNIEFAAFDSGDRLIVSGTGASAPFGPSGIVRIQFA